LKPIAEKGGQLPAINSELRRLVPWYSRTLPTVAFACSDGLERNEAEVNFQKLKLFKVVSLMVARRASLASISAD
jgi:hypothetical protein